MYTKLSEIVGNTPLLEAKSLAKEYGLSAKILLKLEFLNPAGSSKDRVAVEMLKNIPAGATVIEPTSGNTGIGLAAYGVPLGHRVIFTMPDTMSAERVKTLRALGAEVVLTPGERGMTGAHEKAEELRQSIPGSVIPDQFANPANPLAHYKTTGPELERDLKKVPDYFVAAIGTGGTVTGTSRYLKEHGCVHTVGVEPDTSAVLSGGKPGEHKLQGIGAGFVPDALDMTVVDEVIPVSYEDAKKAAAALVRSEGVLVGISAGAALAAALTVAARPEASGKTVAVILPDNGSKYLSTDFFD